MKKLLFANLCLAFSLSVAYGAEQTWTGRVTDSMLAVRNRRSRVGTRVAVYSWWTLQLPGLGLELCRS